MKHERRIFLYGILALLLLTGCGSGTGPRKTVTKKKDSVKKEDRKKNSQSKSDTSINEQQATNKPGDVSKMLQDKFIIPDVEKDQHGNPVTIRDGSKSDSKTGLSFEIWFKEPRIEFVLIPAGEFIMGTPGSEGDHSVFENQHKVRISTPFYMAKYEITQSQWESVMKNNPSEFRNAGKNAPVEKVSWIDCAEFCKKLGMQLPSEAQWEYACRAGTTTIIYSGNMTTLGERNAPELDSIAWYGGNSGVSYQGGRDSSEWKEKQFDHSTAGTHPVGKKKPNAWGLYDMIGNVEEWCEDTYQDNYNEAPTDGSAWIVDDNDYRMIRGGSWNSNWFYCRSAARFSMDQIDSHYSRGFRPVVMVK